MTKLDTIGARLSALRAEIGLAQEDVATRIGVRGQSYHRYEKNKTSIDAPPLLALAELYGTDPRWIFRGDPAEVEPAFADFERRWGQTLTPPLTVAERGRLIWTHHNTPTAGSYLEVILRDRKERPPEVVAAHVAVNDEKLAKAAARGMKRRKP